MRKDVYIGVQIALGGVAFGLLIEKSMWVFLPLFLMIGAFAARPQEPDSEFAEALKELRKQEKIARLEAVTEELKKAREEAVTPIKVDWWATVSPCQNHIRESFLRVNIISESLVPFECRFWFSSDGIDAIPQGAYPIGWMEFTPIMTPQAWMVDLPHVQYLMVSARSKLFLHFEIGSLRNHTGHNVWNDIYEPLEPARWEKDQLIGGNFSRVGRVSVQVVNPKLQDLKAFHHEPPVLAQPTPGLTPSSNTVLVMTKIEQPSKPEGT